MRILTLLALAYLTIASSPVEAQAIPAGNTGTASGCLTAFVAESAYYGHVWLVNIVNLYAVIPATVDFVAEEGGSTNDLATCLI
ncbi:MAG: hypothetical protein ACYC2H_01150 [Thermoplasmatota archaeon]